MYFLYEVKSLGGITTPNILSSNWRKKIAGLGGLSNYFGSEDNLVSDLYVRHHFSNNGSKKCEIFAEKERLLVNKHDSYFVHNIKMRKATGTLKKETKT